MDNIIKANQLIPKVFLGGTCNESTWRERLIPKLKIDYFNPVVPDWTEECYQRELLERQNCSIVLYVITPKMTGVYSIAEVVDDSNKRPERVIFSYFKDDENCFFNDGQIRSLYRVGQMVQNNGGRFLIGDLDVIANEINKHAIVL